MPENDNNHRSISTTNAQHAQEALEVVFNEEAEHRRKSSLVPSNNQALDHDIPHHCIVHSIIEEQRITSPSGFRPDNKPLTKHTDKRPEPVEGREHVHSRLLTKKELRDMAFGIRELAKRLSTLKLKLQVRNIFLLAKANDGNIIKSVREIAEWLLIKEGSDCKVYVEDTLEHDERFDLKGMLNKYPTVKDRLLFWNSELCARYPHTFDIVIALGGDGTVLYASWLFQKIVPPLLAFACGSMGFLTKFDYNAYQATLSRSFVEGITVSLRLRFEATIMRSQQGQLPRSRDIVEELIGEESDDDHTHRPAGSYNILNEVVIDRGPNPTMSTLEVFGDDQHFTTVQADGVCVATPTGSTAYNLAAGGSLCHPENPVILLTAICAHTLSFRPIILPDTIVLRVAVPFDARAGSWASFDGRDRVELHPGDYVTISASRYPFPSILPLDRKQEDWIDSISRTLHWNSRQRQKPWSQLS
ncbi:ATP-NAD kinase [Eremomyces bilateralis CBS 781.70]|uniref:ATP-NAD kinase n=1 Tax=Eremomyces bilateralis CBS 781.70 TaxID=1392243 RepID=A0A6G1GAR7_9PEZI|nr:ATP-NAD kinase [Eremomyces bilateralis CBS 781.70]KAF1815001.1 ATP-NAD kinase [Eremomyces bilateralis CBS 781.70]